MQTGKQMQQTSVSQQHPSDVRSGAHHSDILSSRALLLNNNLQAASTREPKAARETLAFQPSLDAHPDLEPLPEPAGKSE